MREKLRYLPLVLKMFFLAVIAVILYRDRNNLYRFCRYPFPFIMCPQCEYPCFFQVFRLQEIIGLGAAVTGLVGGRVFCGAVCPVGTIQDRLHSLKRRAFSLFHSLTRRVIRAKSSVSQGSTANFGKSEGILGRGLRFLKYPLFLVVFLYALARLARAFDFMPDWGLIPAIQFTLKVEEVAGRGWVNFWLGFLVIVFAVGLAWHRPWCKYLCPYGLLFAVFNKISFLRVKLERKGCTGCRECLKDCTTGKPFSKLEKGFDSVECVRCYDCVLTCPEDKVKIKPRFGKRKGRGSSFF